MRALRRLVQSTDTVPVQFPMPLGELLDANSTATVTVIPMVPMFTNAGAADWAMRVTKPVTATIIHAFEYGFGDNTIEPRETSTANRDVSLKTSVLDPEAEPFTFGVFVAARPERKRLFEVEFTFPKGGLPKRKPFVWVSERPHED